MVSGQSWHWVDPVAGAVKAAQVLRPGGPLAVFGHVFDPPPAVAEAFASVYRRVVPDSPFQPPRRALDLYQAMFAKFAERIREADGFADPQRWQFTWERSYTRDEWLDLLPTTGGLTRLSPEKLAQVLEDVGAAIDTMGGGFTMPYTTLACIAARTEHTAHAEKRESAASSRCPSRC